MRGARLLAVSMALALLMPGQAAAVVPFASQPPDDPYDYASYLFIEDGDCSTDQNELPESFDCTEDWKFTDHRDTPEGLDPDFDPEVWDNPQEFYGVKGVGTNRAWEVTTGRPDVVIAVLDSGIRWEEDRPDLLRKHYLNPGELPVPEGGPNPEDTRFAGYDVTGDGVFNVDDYAADERVSDLNGNGAVDPEDLIRVFSDGVDDDDNGYTDDISGWDFFEDDNMPTDDVDYGHGTGEAEDSGGEAGLSDGQCPNCMVMSLRVGDSFIADVQHWAEAVTYAVDNGVSVVQEALGTLNHTSFGQAAADHAYRNGVIINASEADEAAGHHNWPAAYDHTMVVNSIRTAEVEGVTATPNSYLYLNGCTNYGSYTFASIPSTACSSEATGRSAGVSGLLYSAARNAVERGEMTRYLRDDGTQAPFAVSAEEAMQLWRLSADDIDFSSACAPPVVHDFCDDAPDDVIAPDARPNDYTTTIPGSVRYRSVKGWDFFFGYGRSNAARLVRFLGREGREYLPNQDGTPDPYGVGDSELTAQDRIPPEADLASPRRWRQYGHRDGVLLQPDDRDDPRSIVVGGRVAANRVTDAGGTFDWVLEWAPHAQGKGYPVNRPADGSGEASDGPWTQAASGEGLTRARTGELGRIDVSEVAAALAAEPTPFDPLLDPTSEFGAERFSVRLRLRVIAHPTDEADVVNNEAVTQKQVDVYPAAERALRDDIGVDGLPSGGAGSPSFHDLDGDGSDELILPTEDGLVHAYTDPATGAELDGWPVATDPYPGWRTSGDNAFTRGELGVSNAFGSILLGTAAVADLDGDGTLEVLAADLEGKLYAWEHHGTPRAGFPVTVDRTLSEQVGCETGAGPSCDDYEDAPPKRDEDNTRDWGINSPPATGDLDPTTPGLEIVSGSNDGHVYAWHADGTPVNGWPVILRDPSKVAAMDPDSRFVTYTDDANQERGTKVLVTPSLGDLDRDGDLEVVIGVNEQYEETPNSDVLTDPASPLVRQIEDSGNTRMYVLHHDGAAHPETPETEATAHLHDQAYADGWPVPLAMLVLDLLPYVGQGTNSQAVIADVTAPHDADPELELAVVSFAGPAYLLNHDGTPFYGNGPSGRPLTLEGVAKGPLSVSTDLPSFVAVGMLAAGSLDGGGHVSVAGPAAGLRRLLDVVLPAHQVRAEDHMAVWNGPTGRYEPTFPINVNDLQFFVQPVVADITGDGMAEVIQGTATSDLVAAGIATTGADAVRHFTGGWHIGAAAVGDAPGGETLEVASVTREGYLRLHPTEVASGTEAACTALTEWPEYGHDAHNSGNRLTDAERPGPVTDLEATVEDRAARITLTAPGDDRMCGSVERIEVRHLKGRGGETSWPLASPVGVAEGPFAAGEVVELTTDELDNGAGRLLVRAFDEAGNGSAVAVVEVLVTGRPR